MWSYYIFASIVDADATFCTLATNHYNIINPALRKVNDTINLNAVAIAQSLTRKIFDKLTRDFTVSLKKMVGKKLDKLLAVCQGFSTYTVKLLKRGSII